MTKYLVAKKAVEVYLIAWGALLIGMFFFGLVVEGSDGLMTSLANEYVGPVGASIAVTLFAISAWVMESEASKGRC